SRDARILEPQFDAIGFRPPHGGYRARDAGREQLHAPLPMIGEPAPEGRRAGEVAQGLFGYRRKAFRHAPHETGSRPPGTGRAANFPHASTSHPTLAATQ